MRRLIGVLIACFAAAGPIMRASSGETAAGRAALAPAPPVIDELPALVRDFALTITGSVEADATDSVVVYRASGTDTAAFGLRIAASATFSRTVTLREGDNEIWAVAFDASREASPRSNTALVRYETIIARIYPEVFREPGVFEIDLAERAYEATIDIYTVSGERVARLRKSGAATQFMIEWNLESGDGLPVKNGAYLAVFSVALPGGTTTVEKRFIAVVRR